MQCPSSKRRLVAERCNDTHISDNLNDEQKLKENSQTKSRASTLAKPQVFDSENLNTKDHFIPRIFPKITSKINI